MGTSGTSGAARAPGRGPDHTRRRPPTTVPVIRKELAASGAVTDWALRTRYTRVAPGVVVRVPEQGADPAAFGGFGADAVTRAWANHLVRPEAVLGGWSALALYLLGPDWPDTAPVLLLCERKHGGSMSTAAAVRTPRRPVIWTLPPGTETRNPCPRFPDMRVVSPQLATVQCLWMILTGRHTWWVHDVPGLSHREVRAVQLLDAVAQCTWVTRADILAVRSRLVNRKVLASLLALADDGAQSPMETVLRLMVRDLLPEPYRWESQVRVDLAPGSMDSRTPVTVPDLGSRELKIALYYDGGHHDSASQTDVDFDQFQALRDLGWEVLRFNRDSVRSPGKVREQVVRAIERALIRLSREDDG
jgi:very-short-patch-repair endonuclease